MIFWMTSICLFAFVLLGWAIGKATFASAAIRKVCSAVFFDDNSFLNLKKKHRLHAAFLHTFTIHLLLSPKMRFLRQNIFVVHWFVL